MNSGLQLKSLLESLPFPPFAPRNEVGQGLIVGAEHLNFQALSDFLNNLKQAMNFLPSIIKSLENIEANLKEEKLVADIAIGLLNFAVNGGL